MVKVAGFSSLDALIDATVPQAIRRRDGMPMGKYTEPFTEQAFLKYFKTMASKNVLRKNVIGMGYYGTYLPTVILRNVLENPGWYTQYTPYQAEISQGRLESLLNFQTMICDLTGLPVSNASLLDEATAAAEAMGMCLSLSRGKKPRFLISASCHPQTIAVCQTRADGLGMTVEVLPDSEIANRLSKDVGGVLVQYPATDGSISDYSALVAAAHGVGAKVCAATDLLALTMLKPPGEWGADIAVGSAQRFGVPMGYGGPHAGFLACCDDHKRLMPGRVIGVSQDATGKPALRMAMQTREQHIRRDKATSNICTAQALLANIAALYAVYHGPEGLLRIATRVHGLASVFAAGVVGKLGGGVGGAGAGEGPFFTLASSSPFFDTVTVSIVAGKGKGGKTLDADAVVAAALEKGFNIRKVSDTQVGVSFDETSELADVDLLLQAFYQAAYTGNAGSSSSAPTFPPSASTWAEDSTVAALETLPANFTRQSKFLEHRVFNSYHCEHEMLRYLKRLENRDLSLCHSMIPLGSCTMKLNATTEMIPITWPEFADMHPFCPVDQAAGFQQLFHDLAQQLCAVTGFDAVSFQPNSGAAGEYAGLMAIRAYHAANGEAHRNVCIIPVSAHGTNPASAAMAGLKIVAVATDAQGNISIPELKRQVEAHSKNLAALMVTYPSTHGVYEDDIDEICRIVHQNGGQVYMDGANMNAQVGLTSPGHIGADVCHLNLHKTFCIPHGGGGPGVGPIGVRKHLAPFLPSHPVVKPSETGATYMLDEKNKDSSKPLSQPFGTASAAPYGSALILPISFAYISMMGSAGLEKASKLAILKANYMAARLASHYKVLFRGPQGTCAHEFILDLRGMKETSGIEPEDVAKRLMDFGIHAPTMSWPVPGTLMIEPTESESKAELDRFCEAMIKIRQEIRDIEEGKAEKSGNILKLAPHTASVVAGNEWDRKYSREEAAFPTEWVRAAKFWPTVSRIDNVFGDRNLVVTRSD